MADRGDVFAAVASPVRRALLGLLLDHGPLPVQQLASHFAMSRPSVSEHLKVLKDAGLVREHRSGRHRYYQLEPQPLTEAGPVAHALRTALVAETGQPGR